MREPPQAVAAPAEASEADDALMARFQGGDTDAFEVLYRRHRAPLHRFLLRMCGSPAEAEEAFQDVWLAVVRGARRYSGAGRFGAWLYALAHRRCVDRWRGAGRRRAAEGGLLHLVADQREAAPDEDFDAADLGRALMAAIAVLPPAQREAFLMQAEGGLSLDEIGRATGAGRETVKSRLRYAHQRLRAVVEAHR